MKPVCYSRRAGVETSVIEGAAVLVAPERHLYFAINRIGARIWDLLAKPQTMESLVDTLVGDFAVDEARCRAEAGAFLQQLAERNLIQCNTDTFA